VNSAIFRAKVPAMSVLTGLDVLAGESFARLRGRKVGVLAHPASVDRALRHLLYLANEAGVEILSLFGPEHGVLGDAQDMEHVLEGEHAVDRLTGARLHSLYGSSEASLRPTPAMLEGLEVLVVDLQDVGARYYTFAATMVYAMEAAAQAGVEIMVLDRPNPLGGELIEGPPVDPAFTSFVGAYDLPIRHGLTMGEYARLMRARLSLDLELSVIPMRGYRREMDFEATGVPWVMPSPNMPTVDTAWIYPGMCLFEGTTMSEGRGTTRPFELLGAPWLDGVAWAQRASRHGLPGVILRPCYFTPTFQKHARTRCGAVQIHVTDRALVRSVRLAVVLLSAAIALEPEYFGWRAEAYEFVKDRLAIDLLFGSAGPRLALEGGEDPDAIVDGFAENERRFREERAAHLLY